MRGTGLSFLPIKGVSTGGNPTHAPNSSKRMDQGASEGREEQLLQRIDYLNQELLGERNKVAALTSELGGKKKELSDALLAIQSLRHVVEDHAIDKYIPHTNVEFSTNLSDYAVDERYREAFERAGLQRLLELSSKDRGKVSISSYLFAGGRCPGINKKQFSILTSTRHPIDPVLLPHLIKQMNHDIDEGRPMMVASRMSLPRDVTGCVRNQARSTFDAAIRICYKEEEEKDGTRRPNPKRKQFKCDEKDKDFILFASLDPNTSEFKMKRQVSAVRSMGCWTIGCRPSKKRTERGRSS